MNKEQLKKLEADLWRAADSLRANSDLKATMRVELLASDNPSPSMFPDAGVSQ